MGWTLAPNLARRKAAIEAAYPGTTVFTIGDQAHQAECSDHNPDARGIVHAIDVMTYGDETKAGAIVKWAVGAWDIEYVIHDRHIWSQVTGWQRRVYTGTNPHTDHVHISGKHGSAGRNAATCTGYDTAAEAARPAPLGAIVIDPADVQTIAKATADELLTRWLGNSGPHTAVAWQSGYNNTVAILRTVTALAAAQADDATKADLTEALSGLPALVAAALESGVPGDAPFTPDQVAQVQAAFRAVLSGVGITVQVAPAT